MEGAHTVDRLRGGVSRKVTQLVWSLYFTFIRAIFFLIAASWNSWKWNAIPQIKNSGPWLNNVDFLQHSAEAEESRIQRELEEKAVRLRRFQEDVKKRVVELARVKRQQELQKSYKAVSSSLFRLFIYGFVYRIPLTL